MLDKLSAKFENEVALLTWMIGALIAFAITNFGETVLLSYRAKPVSARANKSQPSFGKPYGYAGFSQSGSDCPDE
jgi:hypothetical protein